MYPILNRKKVLLMWWNPDYGCCNRINHMFPDSGDQKTNIMYFYEQQGPINAQLKK